MLMVLWIFTNPWTTTFGRTTGTPSWRTARWKCTTTKSHPSTTTLLSKTPTVNIYQVGFFWYVSDTNNVGIEPLIYLYLYTYILRARRVFTLAWSDLIFTTIQVDRSVKEACIYRFSKVDVLTHIFTSSATELLTNVFLSFELFVVSQRMKKDCTRYICLLFFC